MKTLTLFLLILAAQVAKGQDSTMKPPYESYIREVSPTEDSLLMVGMHRHFIAPGILSLWDEWVDSCYADSTRYDSTLGVATCGLPICTHLIYPPHSQATSKAWRHHNPNNLQEFIEFIRRRTR